MADYDETVNHVLNGRTAWETKTWDTDSLLYCKEGVLWAHCGASDTDNKYTPDDDDMNSELWELLDSKGMPIIIASKPESKK